jgi:hypothetical protein
LPAFTCGGCSMAPKASACSWNNGGAETMPCRGYLSMAQEPVISEKPSIFGPQTSLQLDVAYLAPLRHVD